MAPQENERNTRSTAVENSLKEIKEQLSNLNRRMEKLEEKVTAQSIILNNLEEIVKINKQMTEDIKSIKADNLQIKSRLLALEKEGDRKQNSERRNQIEIIGIPQNANEVIERIVADLAADAKITISKSDIAKAYRLRARPGKVAPIIIELKETELRDRMIKDLKKRKPKLRTINMEPSDRNIYINESLTPKAKSILYNVKKAANEKKWFRVWTYAGAIYLKMEKEGTQIKIKTIEEMETLLK